MHKDRETWLDDIRAICCILVVMEHLLESLTTAGIMQSNIFSEWFYYLTHSFVVPVFFFTSGYLYQKYKKVETWAAYKGSIGKKLLDFGIPYITFFCLTYVLKLIMAGSVNNELESGFWQSLFFLPPGQLWFLQILLLCYVFTPTMNKKNAWAIISLGILAQATYLFGLLNGIYAVIVWFPANWLWFLLGMTVQYNEIPVTGRMSYIGILVIPLSIIGLVYLPDELWFVAVLIVLGILFSISISKLLKRHSRPVFALVSNCLLPIYLLHTLCAAPVRILLVRMGVIQPAVHFIFGLAASFIIPIMLALLARRFIPLYFLFRPTDAIKKIRSKRKSPQLQ